MRKDRFLAGFIEVVLILAAFMIGYQVGEWLF